MKNNMNKRQSAPRPTAEEALQQMQTEPTQPVEAIKSVRQPIGTEQVHEAMQILQRYSAGTSHLRQKIVESERWYRLRHWECLRRDWRKEHTDESGVEPTSAWLFNSLANRHADMMDNFPLANILAREQGDEAEAKMLSAIVPALLDANDFEETYSDESQDKLNHGTGAYGIFWDTEKQNGLGDITVKECDLLGLFWEPGVEDIQDSRNFFSVKMVPIEEVEEAHPELKGKLGGGSFKVTQYIRDDNIDNSKEVAVVDWYYKKKVGEKTVLHLCKFVGDFILYASENDSEPGLVDDYGMAVKPSMAESGLYDHGMYPFVFDPLFPLKNTPCGMGYIDIGKSPQEYIDRGNQGLMKSLLANAAPRVMSRLDGGVREEEFCDLTKDVVHYEGDPNAIVPVVTKPLNQVYVQLVNDKVDELKETTGNRDVSTGGTGGVTAAAGIAAMQEAGAKLPRDNIRGSYRAYKKVVIMVIELIRQFYDLPRQFRILGENGAYQYVDYSNAGLQPQTIEDGYVRVPQFDLKVVPQKNSPYSKMSQNELTLQLYGAGFFAPQNAVASLVALDMMDFDDKDKVIQKVQQNNMIFQQMQMMQAQLNMLMGQQAPEAPAPGVDVKEPPKKGGMESSVTKDAREKTASLSSPT